MRSRRALARLTWIAAAGAAVALLTGHQTPAGEPASAGVLNVLWDIGGAVFFWALPDSIATEAQIAFLVLLAVLWIVLKVRGRRAARSAPAAGAQETGAQGFQGVNPFTGGPAAGDPGGGPGGENPFAGGAPAPQPQGTNPFAGGPGPFTAGSGPLARDGEDARRDH